jgi:CRP/FNR family transcriptional regulator, cyclic AMP receptor protein
VRLGRDAKVELIRKVPLFAECSRRELAEVASLADEVDLPEGRTLIRQGARGQEFFVLLDGEAVVRKDDAEVRRLKSGDFFGEIALVSDAPRTASVTTVSPARVLVITDRAFRSLLDHSPGIQLKVLKALAERLAPASL